MHMMWFKSGSFELDVAVTSVAVVKSMGRLSSASMPVDLQVILRELPAEYAGFRAHTVPHLLERLAHRQQMRQRQRALGSQS
jgi:hypothetical protein